MIVRHNTGAEVDCGAICMSCSICEFGAIRESGVTIRESRSVCVFIRSSKDSWGFLKDDYGIAAAESYISLRQPLDVIRSPL